MILTLLKYPYQFISKLYYYVVKYHVAKNNNLNIKIKHILKYNKNRFKGPSKTICNAPKNHLYFRTNGNVTPCCKNSFDVYGNICKNTIFEILESISRKNLIKKVENYNLSDGCSFCEYQLNTGNYHGVLAQMYDEFIFFRQKKINQITFEISNTCNLECVMCDETLSALIRKNKFNLPPLNSPYYKNFIDNIKPVLNQIKIARFQGGEPFLIDQYYDIIDYLSKYNSNCKIYIQTNGTILNHKVKNLLKNKNIHLSISIDTLDKSRFESIRKNASFARLMENMNYFIDYSKNNNNKVNINVCIMNNNIIDIEEIYLYCNKNKLSLKLIPVESPRYLALRSTSKIKLKEFINVTENLLNKYPNETLFLDLSYYIKSQYLSNDFELRIAEFKNIDQDILVEKYIIEDLFKDLQLTSKEFITKQINDYIYNNKISKEYLIHFIDEFIMYKIECISFSLIPLNELSARIKVVLDDIKNIYIEQSITTSI